MFVRHPFVRLVSAYQDKVVDTKFFRGWRKKAKHVGDNRAVFSPPQNPRARVPTFEAFVKTILSGRLGQDHHIDYFWRQCNVCNRSYKYDMIGKMETMKEDKKYLFDKLGLKQELSNSKLRKKVSSGGSSEALAREYFSTVDKRLIQKLYERYKADFLLFDYDHQEYLKLGRSTEEDH